jgi:hypothetical protein
MSFSSICREIFSDEEGKKLSAKRVIGGISAAVVLICTIFLTIRDGSTDVVENLLMTIFITSMSLLGLPTIAGAWGKSKVSVGKAAENMCNQQDMQTQQERQHPPYNNYRQHEYRQPQQSGQPFEGEVDV